VKVWVFVEGRSDELALSALWRGWLERLRGARHGISIIPLDGKSRFLRKIGPRAAEKLAANSDDSVVGLPDLYPTRGYEQTPYAHTDFAELQHVQQRLVKQGLEKTQRIQGPDAARALKRFYPSALKHDLEMLLLAAADQLKAVLGTSEALGKWTKPVENQNQERPPKEIVKELFRTKRGRAYRDTVDAPAVLREVADVRDLLYADGLLNCPVFKDVLDHVGGATAIAAYKPDG